MYRGPSPESLIQHALYVTSITDAAAKTNHTGGENPGALRPDFSQEIDLRGSGVESSRKLCRRKFVQVALAAAAAGSAISCGGVRSPWGFLTVDEARTLAAICDQIIPPDQDPGAAWAGVVNYIDRQLCGPFKHLRRTYRQGLVGIDQCSHALAGTPFVNLIPAKQIELLAALESGKVSGDVWKDIRSQEFFSMVVEHTMQGFYGDPRHGGNRETASWKMLNLPYPPIRGRAKYS